MKHTKTFENFINQSTDKKDYADEMAYGQLEKCIDYANMIRKRIEEGTELDPWMHSQIAVAENELNSIWDAIDGDDGVVEKSNLNEDMRSELKSYIKKNKKEIDALADTDNWEGIYRMLFNDFRVDADSADAEELKTVFNIVY